MANVPRHANNVLAVGGAVLLAGIAYAIYRMHTAGSAAEGGARRTTRGGDSVGADGLGVGADLGAALFARHNSFIHQSLRRLPAPCQAGALPGCATPRLEIHKLLIPLVTRALVTVAKLVANDNCRKTRVAREKRIPSRFQECRPVTCVDHWSTTRLQSRVPGIEPCRARARPAEAAHSSRVDSVCTLSAHATGEWVGVQSARSFVCASRARRHGDCVGGLADLRRPPFRDAQALHPGDERRPG